MKWVVTLLFAILLPQCVLADAFKGLSAFASTHPNFPCDRYLRIVSRSPKPAMAVLWGTFGVDSTCIQRFVDAFKDRPHLVEIHFSNEVCRRNHRCYEGELFIGTDVKSYNKVLENIWKPENEGYLYDLIVRAQLISSFLKAIGNSNTNGVISTGLEDNYTTKAYNNLYQIIRSQWHGLIIRNPVGGNGKYRGDADGLESHSKSPSFNDAACFVNEDGDLRPTYSKTRKLLRKFNYCIATFAWRKEHQGVGGKFIPPRQRGFTISDRDIIELGRILSE